MLVGCLLRHFKVYENIVFSPITLGAEGKLSVFTGNNGVGKSSILEAINHFFHQNKWIINNKAKKSEAYIAPLFLIRKSEFKPEIPENLLNAISNYFWSVDETANPTISRNESLKEFLSYRDKLKTYYNSEEYYLLLIGLKHPNDTSSFVTFDSDIRAKIESSGIDIAGIDKLYKAVLDHYSYVYIPVESSTQNILRLESFELQELMDRDVLNEIDGILNNKIQIPRETLGLDRGPAKVGFSPLKHINEKLDKFIAEANTSIQNLDSSYAFGTERNQKRNLSVQDIRDRVIDEYFSIRPLRKDGKLIEDLSSGEQRIALFDIAYSLLSQGKRTKKNLILAIDEPEASMHMSQCYKQFLQISKISSEYGHQVLVTSHWYGFLPVIAYGYINHIEHSPAIKIYQHNLRGITSERKRLPDDISLKSMFDLVSSMIGMMRSEATNWLVCEGVGDQTYLKAILDGKISNLCILPVGGIDNVVKLYNYLCAPLSESSEKKEISGKIVCITDTDTRPVYPSNYITMKDGILTIRRLDLNLDKFKLVELNPATERHITAIEDLLDSKIFYLSASKVIEEFACTEIKDLFSKMELLPNVKYAGFSDSISCLKGKDIDSHMRKRELIDFLSNHEIKYKLASQYISTFKDLGAPTPEWAAAIIDLFHKKTATQKESPEKISYDT